MDISWLIVVSTAVFVAVVLLLITCVDCGNKGPLVSIRQANTSEEYMPSTEFRVIHLSQPNTDLNLVHSPSNLLSPFSNSSDPASQRRHRSYTPTETESNPSYENPGIGPESLESDAEDPGYIIVLPEGEGPPINQSPASTPSSDVRHDYENIVDTDYLNVDSFTGAAADISAQSDSSNDDDDDDDDDDDEGNYVNQPPMIHS